MQIVSGRGFSDGGLYPTDLSVAQRYAPRPSNYVATRQIELLPGFETGLTDEMIAEIINPTDNPNGSTGIYGGEGSYEAYGYYRYGFNGQEKSDEIKGSGNSYTAEFWEYDPRLGRRWNVDPVGKHWESPYVSLSNNPIIMVDPNGDSDTASIHKVGIYQDVMNTSAEDMKSLGSSIKNNMSAISKMKSILNSGVVFDLTMSFNPFYWLPKMGGEAVSGQSDIESMSELLGNALTQLQIDIAKYNEAYNTYRAASKSLQLEFQNATHFDIGGIVLDRLGVDSKRAGVATMFTHLNRAEATGNFVLYEVIINGETFKYGIADANRMRKGGQWAGYPERVAQQLSKINKYAPELDVLARVRPALNVSKARMILIETETILTHAKSYGIPIGNISHIKKYVETFGKAEMSAKTIKVLSKFLKL